MELRGPDAHLSTTPGGWRRTGDGSNWARLRSAEEEEEDDVEVRPHASRGLRGPRPQSAIERGQRGGGWPRQVENPQGGSYFGDPVLQRDRVPLFNELTTSMPALSREPTTARQGLHSFHHRDVDSSCSGSLSLSQWESSVGSQESLQACSAAAAERRGSWERARITQAPGSKEHTRLSNLTTVKIGWLPIKRRVVETAGPGQSQHMDQYYASQVKLKQPIAPTLQRAPVSSANGCRHLGGEVERSLSGPSVVGSRTWQQQQQQAPCLASPAGEQVPEKLTSTRSEGDRLLGWQALKRGWAFNRAPPLCARSQPGDGPDANGRSPPVDVTTGTESTGVGPYRPHAPLCRSGGAQQPVRPTVPLDRVERSCQPSHVETSSAVATLVPQTSAGFSSITISSRKVLTRSSSLPISLPPGGHSSSAAGPDPDLVTMERKATIVKVTEHSVTSSRPPRSSPDQAESRPYKDPPRTPDTLVRRRKATIIKVTTEHRETYVGGPPDGPPDYRHSYTEGLYREDCSVWRPRDLEGTSELDSSSTPSGRSLGSPEGTSWACETTDTSTSFALSDPESEGQTLHRSTLSLYVSVPPGVEAPLAPPELSPTAAGETPVRPLSCYGRVYRHAEPSREENVVARPAISRSLSVGPESDMDSAGSPAGGLPSRHDGTSREGTHQPRGDGSVRGPPRLHTPLRPSLSTPLTLIKSPDPDKQQTPEDILAANAAAIIANIKLQRRLNPPVTSSSSSSSPQRNTAGCARSGEKARRSAQRPDQQRTVHLDPPHAGFVPLSPDPNRRADTAVSLQEALEKSRPDFISRSQGRVRELEQKTQARRRREAAVSLEPRSDAILGPNKAGRHHPPRGHHAAQTDNLLRDRDRAITGRETPLRSQRFHNSLPEVKRKREAEKKRELYLTNRQRVELFKKKLLDQILQRTSD